MTAEEEYFRQLYSLPIKKRFYTEDEVKSFARYFTINQQHIDVDTSFKHFKKKIQCSQSSQS